MNNNKHPIGQTENAYEDNLKAIEKETHLAAIDGGSTDTTTLYKTTFPDNNIDFTASSNYKLSDGTNIISLSKRCCP